MQLKSVSAAAVALFAASSSFAAFPSDCSVNDLSIAATACAGIYTSNFGNNLGAGNTAVADLAAAFGDMNWALSVAELPFAGDETGTITIGPAISGPFAIALKAGSEQSGGGYSLYYYDTSYTGVVSLDYTRPPVGKALSHASLYVASAPVPEPETYALMLAGLFGVGLLARRRRAG